MFALRYIRHTAYAKLNLRNGEFGGRRSSSLLHAEGTGLVIEDTLLSPHEARRFNDFTCFAVRLVGKQRIVHSFPIPEYFILCSLILYSSNKDFLGLCS